uniref:TraB domain-containing protein n=1 Tax=Aegilops tauschii subsp. strangulata TaxID=200361 RepID=A0A453RQ16_AEGTS
TWGGQSALALRLLLAVFSSKISSGANRPFGEEFRAARRVSEDIGAQLVLGDRPIEITLERALKSLSWDEKTKLVISLFRGITSTTDMPQDEKAAVSPYELYEKLSSSYPSLLQPLVHERDMFMAWSLKRSKAVNKSKTVVGVIGKGHMNGVVYALISDQG